MKPTAQTLFASLPQTAERGSFVSLDSSLQCPPSQCTTVPSIHVRGTFTAGERTAVRAFPVGKPSAEQRKAQEGTTRVGGQDVKLVPAEEQKK